MVGVPLLLWKLLDEVKPGDKVLVNRTRRQDDPGTSERERNVALLLGAFVAEGWVGAWEAGFDNSDPEYFDAVANAYDAVVGTPMRTYDAVVSGRPIHRLVIRDLKKFRESELAELGVAASREKRVPEAVWRGSREFKRIFLESLFEGDGSSS